MTTVVRGLHFLIAWSSLCGAVMIGDLGNKIAVWVGRTASETAIAFAKGAAQACSASHVCGRCS